MNTQEKDKIISLLSKKIERQSELKQKIDELEKQDEQLVDSKIFRSVNSSYLFLKRGILLILGSSLVILSILTLVYPNLIDAIFNKDIPNELNDVVRIFAVITLGSGFILLYISRMVRKMRVRNRQITQAESVTRQIIKNYKTTIKEEEQEIESLNQILKPFLSEDTITSHITPLMQDAKEPVPQTFSKSETDSSLRSE